MVNPGTALCSRACKTANTCILCTRITSSRMIPAWCSRPHGMAKPSSAPLCGPAIFSVVSFTPNEADRKDFGFTNRWPNTEKQRAHNVSRSGNDRLAVTANIAEQFEERHNMQPSVDLAHGASAVAEVKYGLPREVKFCRRCVISNQRPNSVVEYSHTIESSKRTIHFDREGVCDACRFAESKRQTIDWEQRERELQALCNKFRRDEGQYYCLG